MPTERGPRLGATDETMVTTGVALDSCSILGFYRIAIFVAPGEYTSDDATNQTI